MKLAKNPDVSVRMRGVIECTYCVQRIESTKIIKKAAAGMSDDVRVVDSDGLKTACQQVCAAEAISFGNLLEDGSEVNREKANPRNYETIDFLTTARVQLIWQSCAIRMSKCLMLIRSRSVQRNIKRHRVGMVTRLTVITRRSH